MACNAGEIVGPDSLSCVPPACPSGQVWNGSACAPGPACDAGKPPFWIQFPSKAAYDSAASGASAGGACVQGCKALRTGPGGQNPSIGLWELQVGLSGDSCTPSASPPTPTVPANCPAGQAPGTVNGVSTCAPPSTSVNTGSTTTTNSTTSNGTGASTGTGGTGAGTGTGTGTGTGADPGAAGSENGGGGAPNTQTTTGKTTTCTGGLCTTTTVTTTAPIIGGVASSGAGVTSTTTGTGTQADYCAANPKAFGCEDKSITGGGDCSVPITQCDGDAIACAIAREQLREYCTYNPPNNSLAQEGQKIVDGTQALPDDPRLPGNIPNVDISADGGIDMSDAIGGGGCPADPQIAVMGRSFAIPFSSLCGSLSFLGNVAVFAALLLAARIVMEGIA
ncbi:MAG: hypothetical protein JWQ04_94 [Pedosphaera sp.]|nr:hypothetical protein [Pedosphaera sp.]